MQNTGRLSKKADFRLEAVLLRGSDHVAREAPYCWFLLAASGLIFIIACSNAANLILARTCAAKASRGARRAWGERCDTAPDTARRELLLCGAGALVGVLFAGPMVASPRALRVAILGPRTRPDSSTRACLGSAYEPGALAAVLLAFVPRLPSADATHGTALANGGLRMPGQTSRRLQRIRGNSDCGVLRAAWQAPGCW